MIALWVCWIGSGLAWAKSAAWLSNGARSVDISGKVDLPLHRGPTTHYLPAVPLAIPVEGQDVPRPVLGVIDIAGGGSRVSLEMANALALSWDWVVVSGERRRIVVLDTLVVGDSVTLHQLKVEVVTEAPGFVLGLTALDELAAAVLPSKGVLRLVPATDGEAMVRSVAEPIRVTPQPPKRFTSESGREFRGDGLTLRVPGGLRWGETTVEGTVHLRTDAPVSRVAASPRLPDPTLRGGHPTHEVGATLGSVWLADTWIRQVEDLADPAPNFYGALGYDVLFGVDLAVSVSHGLVAFQDAGQVRWTDAEPVAVASSRARYEQEEKRLEGTDEATNARDERVQIGFDGPLTMGIDLGDPGSPIVRDRNLDLAETLWEAGALDEALRHYLSASTNAGDHCLSHLRLGQRRLAWAGSQQENELVVDLVRDPLVRAATLWDVWVELDPLTRESISEGDLSDERLAAIQSEDCRISRGLWLASANARGDFSVAELVIDAYGAVPSVVFARGIRQLREGSWVDAEPLLTAAAISDGGDPLDLQLAIAVAMGGLKHRRELVDILRRVSGYPTDHPLTAAFIGLEAAVLMGDPPGVTRKLWRADDRWLPGELVYRWASGTIPELGAWDERNEHRQPGRPQVLCQKAVHLALNGRLTDARALLDALGARQVADWWTAKAVVAHIANDPVARDTALYELRLRYPLLPAGRMGLR